jgi:hypothetical protein
VPIGAGTPRVSRYAGFVAKDAATAERHLIAAAALVAILETDPRVEKLYQDWRRECGLAEAIAQWRRASERDARDQAGAELLLTAYGSGVLMTSLVLPSFVSKELRLPWPWLALELAGAFQARVLREFTGDARWQIGALVAAPRGGSVARGRRAKAGGASIEQAVQWFYRARVKEPRDSARSLGRQYRNSRQHMSAKSTGRSSVEQAIERAKALLDAAEFVFTPLPK